MLAPFRRLGAVGDVHGEARRLAIAIDRLRAMDAERILLVGDFVDGGDDPIGCCARVTDPDVVAVRGNHERWLLADQMRDIPDATPVARLDGGTREILSRLPATVRLRTSAGGLLLCHGLGDDDMASVLPAEDGRDASHGPALRRLLRDEVAVVVNGHSHKRMVRSFGDLTIVNVGTLCSGESPCFALIDLDARRVEFHDFDDHDGVAPGPSFQFGLPGQGVWDVWGG